MDVGGAVMKAREYYGIYRDAHHDKIVEIENTINSRASQEDLMLAEYNGAVRRGNSRFYVRLA
jgi:hypothetical protein